MREPVAFEARRTGSAGSCRSFRLPIGRLPREAAPASATASARWAGQAAEELTSRTPWGLQEGSRCSVGPVSPSGPRSGAPPRRSPLAPRARGDGARAGPPRGPRVGRRRSPRDRRRGPPTGIRRLRGAPPIATIPRHPPRRSRIARARSNYPGTAVRVGRPCSPGGSLPRRGRLQRRTCGPPTVAVEATAQAPRYGGPMRAPRVSRFPLLAADFWPGLGPAFRDRGPGLPLGPQPMALE